MKTTKISVVISALGLVKIGKGKYSNKIFGDIIKQEVLLGIVNALKIPSNK